MSWLDGLRHRLYVFVRGERYAREVAREMDFHIDLDAHSTSASDAAWDRARQSLGNATYYREEVRRMTMHHWIDRIRQDASYAWRGLLRTPGFTVVVIATLGLGLGVNAAIYSVLRPLLFHAPTGVVDPASIRRLYVRIDRSGESGASSTSDLFSYPQLAALRQRATPSAVVAAFTGSAGASLGENGIDSTRISHVTSEFFAVLGLHAHIGRFFAPDEGDVRVETPIAVISDALWRRSFHADAGVLGHTVRINERPFTIVGVAPPGFAGVETDLVEIWLPLNTLPAVPFNRRPWYEGSGKYLHTLARIDAAAEPVWLQGATAAIQRVSNASKPDKALSVLSGPVIEARGPQERASEVTIATRLAGISLIVLVVAGANITNMLLLRASGRRREIAVRRALGVSNGRLYSQLLTESAVLGAISGGVALLFAMWAGIALRRLLLPTIHWAASPVDVNVIVITIGTAAIAGVVPGLFPAFGATRLDVNQALMAGGGRRRYRHSRTGSMLLVVQAALSVVLVVGAGLFVRSLGNVQSIDVGYNPDGLLMATAHVRGGWSRPAIGAELLQIADRLRTEPGVVATAVSATTPMSGAAFQEAFLPGRDSAVTIGGAPPIFFAVSPGFFEATGVQVISGREFDRRDGPEAQQVMVVSSSMARSLWPGASPIGKCLIVGEKSAPCRTIVGVAENVHLMRIVEDAGTQFYVPVAQAPQTMPTTIVARVSSGHMASAISGLGAELRRIFPNSSIGLGAMTDRLARDLHPWRMGAILVSALGMLALVVTAIGIYGVVGYSMSMRRHEVGVRIALGARTSDVFGLVIREAAGLTSVGMLIGLAISLLAGRLVRSLLYGIAPGDAGVHVFAALTICAVAIIASAVPGWRAARVDPVTALRAE